VWSCVWLREEGLACAVVTKNCSRGSATLPTKRRVSLCWWPDVALHGGPSFCVVVRVVEGGWVSVRCGQ